MAKQAAKASTELKAEDPMQAIKAVQESHEDLLKTAGPGMVYGRAIKYEDMTIIPTAEVLVFSGFGYASGSGSGFGEDPEAEETSGGAGEGGGGGGKTLSRPVAVVIASPAGVRVEPIFDRTKVYMAAITAVGFMVAMMMRFMRPRKFFGK